MVRMSKHSSLLTQLQGDIGNKAPTYLRDLIGRLSTFSDEPRVAGLVGLVVTMVMDMAYTSSRHSAGVKGKSAGSSSSQVSGKEWRRSACLNNKIWYIYLIMKLWNDTKRLPKIERLLEKRPYAWMSASSRESWSSRRWWRSTWSASGSTWPTKASWSRTPSDLRPSSASSSLSWKHVCSGETVTPGERIHHCEVGCSSLFGSYSVWSSRSLRHWASGAAFNAQMLVHLAALEGKAEPFPARAALQQYKEDLAQIIPVYR